MVMTATTNEALGSLLGVSHATISRIKSGDRLPSLEVMDRIREQFDWSIDDQTQARKDGTYARQFVERVGRYQPTP